MATTSIKLPDELKDRVRSIAQARGKSAHAFLLESVQNAVEAAERQISFLADADAAYRQMRETGEGYKAGDVHDYLRARVRGEPSSRPQPKPWRE